MSNDSELDDFGTQIKSGQAVVSKWANASELAKPATPGAGARSHPTKPHAQPPAPRKEPPSVHETRPTNARNESARPPKPNPQPPSLRSHHDGAPSKLESRWANVSPPIQLPKGPKSSSSQDHGHARSPPNSHSRHRRPSGAKHEEAQPWEAHLKSKSPTDRDWHYPQDHSNRSNHHNNHHTNNGERFARLGGHSIGVSEPRIHRSDTRENARREENVHSNRRSHKSASFPQRPRTKSEQQTRPEEHQLKKNVDPTSPAAWEDILKQQNASSWADAEEDYYPH